MSFHANMMGDSRVKRTWVINDITSLDRFTKRRHTDPRECFDTSYPRFWYILELMMMFYCFWLITDTQQKPKNQSEHLRKSVSKMCSHKNTHSKCWRRKIYFFCLLSFFLSFILHFFGCCTTYIGHKFLNKFQIHIFHLGTTQTTMSSGTKTVLHKRWK